MTGQRQNTTGQHEGTPRGGQEKKKRAQEKDKTAMGGVHEEDRAEQIVTRGETGQAGAA